MTEETTIIQKLNALAEMKSEADAIRLHYDEIRKTLIPPEIIQAIADLDAEQETALSALSAGVASLEAEIKAAVIERGASVKGTYLQAVWVKGRTTWDADLLKGYALAHPEINVARKTGDPSVSFRIVK